MTVRKTHIPTVLVPSPLSCLKHIGVKFIIASATHETSHAIKAAVKNCLADMPGAASPPDRLIVRNADRKLKMANIVPHHK